MNAIWKAINGHKTQLAAAVGPLLLWLVGRNYIAQDTADLLAYILGLWSAGAIAHGVAKQRKAAREP